MAAAGGRTYPVRNPATGALVAHVADAGRDDVARAVAAAQAAFAEGIWRRTPAPQRGEVLRAAAERIEAREAELARLESLCSGKPVTDCLAEVRAAARYFRFYGAAVNHMTGQTIPVANTGLDFTLREPIGVCALIVPWNGPIAIAAKKAAPALAAGNSVVLKPAPPTPLTALELEAICRAAGVPPGVFSVLTGSGRELGQQLVEHPDVAKISFTGSTDTGADILRRAAAGHQAGQPGARRQVPQRRSSPTADIGQVAESAIAAVFANSGQDCCARSRMIVRAAGVRTVRRGPGRPGRAGPPGRSARPADPARQPDLGGPAGPGAGLHRPGGGRGGGTGLRRRRGAVGRAWRPATRSRPRC